MLQPVSLVRGLRGCFDLRAYPACLYLDLLPWGTSILRLLDHQDAAGTNHGSFFVMDDLLNKPVAWLTRSTLSCRGVCRPMKYVLSL
ncbi:hypothetical protein WJX77_002013 [Trebouxia sp. C0004]